MENFNFADLHCHPHMRSFNNLRHSKYEKKSKLKEKYFHPWFIVFSPKRAIKKGRRASSYSQSDLIKLTNGNVKVAFVSLYPMEKGWIKKKDKPHCFFSRLWYYFLYGCKIMPIGMRDILQHYYMKLPFRRINFFQSENYNYFEELNREKDFILTKNNIKTRGEIFIPNFFRKLFTCKKRFKGEPYYYAEGTYEIATSGSDIPVIIAEDKTAFVFSIEGANVFNSNGDADEIITKINQVKQWKVETVDGVKDLPVLFINFAHHFNNFLCGHSRSIIKIGRIFIDQSDGMNNGIDVKGAKIIRSLLNLDDDNNKLPGKRILIDVKHMGACSRKNYYDEIIKPCRTKGDSIPIIASHCGYSGKNTLNELIAYAQNEKDEDSFYTVGKPFNIWSINLCNEDILEIFKSGGIIGINLDQRILAMPKKKRFKHYPSNYDISFIWRNIKSMMDVIINSPSDPELPPKEKVVNLFGLGSDFDGYIDPLDKYSTTLSFNNMANDLLKEIDNDADKAKYLFGLSPFQLVEKICIENAKNFAINYL